MTGPTIPLAEEIHSEKYRLPGESFEEACNRIAVGLTESSEEYHVFRNILLTQRFLPGGRVQAAIGSPKRVTAYNCFVSGKIEDSMRGIMQRAGEAAETLRSGGGIGYDFSTLRPSGDMITTLMSQSSGPVSFMEIFNSVCGTIRSAGHRRGAQMGVMRVDHPDILEFIHAKQNDTRLTNFNVSVGITDEFMTCVKHNLDFSLHWGNRVRGSLPARDLWEAIMRSTWDWAEPGVLFIDRINTENNLWYCEEITATNPCGEQPLPPFGACLLGSFNLVQYVSDLTFDMFQLKQDVTSVVRAMDRVIDVTSYPLDEQKEEAEAKRRMGLGVTGVANALEYLGFPYGSSGFLDALKSVLKCIRDEAYRTSVQLAKERGTFPMYSPLYLASNFIQRLPDDIRLEISNSGIRNSHLTSIAPTGTISLTANNVSSGIEPVFAREYTRIINMPQGVKRELVQDYGVRVLGVEPKVASGLTAMEHVEVLLQAQRYVDSAVSKTVNVNPNMAWDDFKGIYLRAWVGGAKGCTTFNSGGKRYGILTTEDDTPGAACWVDPDTGVRTCDE